MPSFSINFNAIEFNLNYFLLFCTILYHIFLNMSRSNLTMLSSSMTMLSNLGAGHPSKQLDVVV
jgi:hypothetical protein